MAKKVEAQGARGGKAIGDKLETDAIGGRNEGQGGGRMAEVVEVED